MSTAVDAMEAGRSPAEKNRGVPAEHDDRSEPSSRMAGAKHAELLPTVTTTADVPSAFECCCAVCSSQDL